MNRLSRGIAAACLAALATAAAGCGTATPARPATTAATASAMPLDTVISTAAGTWAAVEMGGSAARYNNFWQLFIRPAGSTRWKLVTPPGTADNGGLVVAGGARQDLITAFLPSHDLHYTPLTRTGDAGQAWSGLNPLDAILASTPGSLAVQPKAGRLLALLATGTIRQGTANGTSWTTLATARALAATPAGRACGLRALTTVAYTPARTPLLGGSCARPGMVGIFAATGHTWQASGPTLHGALKGQAVTVLRLGNTGSQVTALLMVGTGRHAILAAAWRVGRSASWTLSPVLPADGQTVSATSLGPGHTAAIITAGGHGAELANGQWRTLPALPPATIALAPGPDSTIDALAVRRGTLTVWHLASKQSRWAQKQVISVPIQYGSSG